jgi:hypothetical protein
MGHTRQQLSHSGELFALEEGFPLPLRLRPGLPAHGQVAPNGGCPQNMAGGIDNRGIVRDTSRWVPSFRIRTVS